MEDSQSTPSKDSIHDNFTIFKQYFSNHNILSTNILPHQTIFFKQFISSPDPKDLPSTSQECKSADIQLYSHNKSVNASFEERLIKGLSFLDDAKTKNAISELNDGIKNNQIAINGPITMDFLLSYLLINLLSVPI